ncbi:MAG: ABC transporter ATP-binding protein [Alphaproteobacteria bacterium]|nr:ABC transporter ATP-binding protein [Alphaproteobacteria bacterium]
MTDLLSAADVTVQFGGLVAVNAVSLTVPAGAIYGVIGPNGAGKTTFFNAIAGLVSVNPGAIRFDGHDITRLPPYRRARLGIRRTFQAVQLLPQFTALENVLVGLHSEIREDYWRSLFGWSGRSAADEEAQERAVETLRFLGILDVLFKRPREMTFAQQRFVEIARALVSRPKLLMLDEPAAGLSPQEVGDINRLLRKLRQEWGMTIILVEHVLSLVLDVSDRVTVLDNGRVIAEGPPRAVEADPRVKAVYLGEEHA